MSYASVKGVCSSKMDNLKRISIYSLAKLFGFVFFVLIVFTSCKCRHEWRNATCTEPQTCVKCGEAQGEPLGHSFVSTIIVKPGIQIEGIKSDTCSICGLKEENAMPPITDVTVDKLAIIPPSVTREDIPGATTITFTGEATADLYYCKMSADYYASITRELYDRFPLFYQYICGSSVKSFEAEALEALRFLKVDGNMVTIENSSSDSFYIFAISINCDTASACSFQSLRPLEKMDVPQVQYEKNGHIKIDGRSTYCVMSLNDDMSNAISVEEYIPSDWIGETVYLQNKNGIGMMDSDVSCHTVAVPKITHYPQIELSNNGDGTFTIKKIYINEELQYGDKSPVSNDYSFFYTIDGSDPVPYESELYKNNPITYAQDKEGFVTVKAIAVYKKSKSLVGQSSIDVFLDFRTKVVSGELIGTWEMDGAIYGSSKDLLRIQFMDNNMLYLIGKNETMNGQYRIDTVTRRLYATAFGYKEEYIGHFSEDGSRLYLSDYFTDDVWWSKTYKIGDIGPAGGIVFYDCDADNAEGNSDGLISRECGWRYLEASPEDLTNESTEQFTFGYYRTSSNGNNLYVNGDTSYLEGKSDINDGKCTGTAIGTGKANTVKLVKTMGSVAYTSSSGKNTTALYAAKLADDYTYGGYDDWFLPSKDELNLMYTNLQKTGKTFFANEYYWSSSEAFADTRSAWTQAIQYGLQNFSRGNQANNNRYSSYRVRCIRAF